MQPSARWQHLLYLVSSLRKHVSVLWYRNQTFGETVANLLTVAKNYCPINGGISASCWLILPCTFASLSFRSQPGTVSMLETGEETSTQQPPFKRYQPSDYSSITSHRLTPEAYHSNKQSESSTTLACFSSLQAHCLYSWELCIRHRSKHRILGSWLL